MSRRVILLVIMVAGAVGALWWWHTRAEVAPWRPALDSREVAARVLAEYLARRYPGAKALVLGNPFVQRPGQGPEIYAFERASIQGLQRGFGSRSSLEVVYPELRSEFLQRPEKVFVDPKTTTPLSFLISENTLDQLTQTHPGFELLVSLIGLPVNVRDSRLWRESEKPRLALLLPDWRILGDHDSIRASMKSEKVVAAVMPRPGYSGEDETEKDYQAQFKRRFLLVTKENIDQILKAYPQLF
jgi:hypothetical protein